jgi:hypothetical protein
MTNKTTESYGKNANRAQTERSFKRLSRRSQDTCDVFSGLSLAKDLDLGRYLMVSRLKQNPRVHRS